jgi:hypothetical protein
LIEKRNVYREFSKWADEAFATWLDWLADVTLHAAEKFDSIVRQEAGMEAAGNKFIPEIVVP